MQSARRRESGVSISRWPAPWVLASGILLLLAHTAAGQTYSTTAPNDILAQYHALRSTWTTNIWIYANRLFSFLALIDFAWSAIALALDRTDLQSWTAGLIRKVMWLGAFYALLVNGLSWIPAIIDSFEIIGANAAGLAGPLDPGAVFAQGLSIAAALLDGASGSAFFTNPATSLALVVAAVLIVISYVIITINFIVTIVESYLVVSAGFLFLGFGGSRWTAPYTERYIGLAVSIGVKVLLLYCLISGGSSLSFGWLTKAAGIATATEPAMTAFDIMGASLIYMMLCWQIPKLFGAVLGGAPALTGGDLVSTGATVVGAGIAAASLAAGGASAIAGRLAGGPTAATAAGASATSGSNNLASMVNAVSAASTNVDPHVSRTSTGGSGAAQSSSRGAKSGIASDVANVSSASGAEGGPRTGAQANSDAMKSLAAMGGESLVGSGFEGETPARGFSPSSASVTSEPSAETNQVPSDGRKSDIGSGTPNSDVAAAAANVSSPASKGPPPRSRFERIASATRKTDQTLRAAHDKLHDARRRIGPLSDAAPPPQPPRMPIDHQD